MMQMQGMPGEWFKQVQGNAGLPEQKWGPALLPAPICAEPGYAGVR